METGVQQIYLNNAATTWPKPDCVYEAVDRAMRSPGSARRGGGDLGDAVEEARRDVASFLGARDASRLSFLPGCTYALNLAILGLPWRADDVAVMSSVEHHAVSRPIRKAAKRHGFRFETLAWSKGAPVDLEELERILKTERVRLVACTMASNVTGEVLPVKQIARMAREHGAFCLIDAAQAAGVVPVDVEDIGADMIGFAGHKGLFGPVGVGGLWVNGRVDLSTLAEGGTGGDSGRHEMSGRSPSDFEVGTVNTAAIVGLATGVRWLREQGLERVHGKERALAGRLLAGLSEMRGVTIYGPLEMENRTAAVSINVEGAAPQEVAEALHARRGVVCRAGFHCAPMAHEAVGSYEHGGAVRLSPGFFNRESDVDAAIEGIAEMARAS